MTPFASVPARRQPVDADVWLLRFEYAIEEHLRAHGGSVSATSDTLRERRYTSASHHALVFRRHLDDRFSVTLNTRWGPHALDGFSPEHAAKLFFGDEP